MRHLAVSLSLLIVRAIIHLHYYLFEPSLYSHIFTFSEREFSFIYIRPNTTYHIEHRSYQQHGNIYFRASGLFHHFSCRAIVMAEVPRAAAARQRRATLLSATLPFASAKIAQRSSRHSQLSKKYFTANSNKQQKQENIGLAWLLMFHSHFISHFHLHQ